MAETGPDLLRSFALVGARAELTRILALFPELRAELATNGRLPRAIARGYEDVAAGRVSTANDIVHVTDLRPKAPRRQRRMSAAQRTAVSKRMKAYWAKRRAG